MPIGTLFSQDIIWVPRSSKNKFNEDSFGTPQTVRGRLEQSAKIIKGPQGEDIGTDAELFFPSSVVPSQGDKIIFDDVIYRIFRAEKSRGRDSINHNEILLQRVALESDSQIASALFDGASGSYIEVPYAPDLRNQDWSLIMWVKPTLLQVLVGSQWSDTAFIAQRDGTGTGRTILDCHIQNGNILTGHFYLGSFLNGIARDSTAELTVNTSAMIGLTYDAAADTLRFYMNGALVGTFTSAIPELATGNLILGAHKSGSTNRYNGYMSKFRAFSERVTDDEMLELYQFDVLPDKDIEIEYLFDSLEVLDTSGNDRHTVLSGGVTMTTVDIA